MNAKTRNSINVSSSQIVRIQKRLHLQQAKVSGEDSNYSPLETRYSSLFVQVLEYCFCSLLLGDYTK
ncbi:hypothetical protein CFP56_036338 [Quercus suber]|uniref:Uncharacterized protein n=1 Tax=Quercus suber TaxID=58331 RepID=A0AAW0J7Q2_QUESU